MGFEQNILSIDFITGDSNGAYYVILGHTCHQLCVRKILPTALLSGNAQQSSE